MSRFAASTRNLIRLRLFFVSYAPLWAMLALRALPPSFRHWNDRFFLAGFFACMTVLGLYDAKNLMRGARATTPRRVLLKEVDDQGGNVAGYLATYLLPFIGLVPVDLWDWLAYTLFFLVTALVFVQTDLVLINPTLFLLRHSVVTANVYLSEKGEAGVLLDGSPFVVVCRNPSAIKDVEIDVVSLAGGLITMREPSVERGPG